MLFLVYQKTPLFGNERLICIMKSREDATAYIRDRKRTEEDMYFIEVPVYEKYKKGESDEVDRKSDN